MATDNLRPGRTGAKRHGDKGRETPPVEADLDIPELEVTVVARRKGNVIATERFAVPLLITSQNAKAFSQALASHYTKAVNRVLEVVKKGG